MSVIVVAKFPCDTAAFQASLSARSAEYRRFAQESQAQGAIHHRFGVGDGYVLVVDEWDNAASFERFIANPELQAFTGEIGVSGAPDVIIAEAVSSPDEY